MIFHVLEAEVDFSSDYSMFAHTLEDLSFCAIPAISKYLFNSSFAMLLNLFVAQLYLRSYEKCLSICRFLGLGFYLLYEQI